jgi:hypothetical protein
MVGLPISSNQHALKQVGDLDAAHYDTSAWLDTARFLLQGILNLAAQRDWAINIQLARGSQKIAEDSKRDSSSMMSLSIVAMLFRHLHRRKSCPSCYSTSMAKRREITPGCYDYIGAPFSIVYHIPFALCGEIDGDYVNVDLAQC